jgi:hypothetical protein
VGRVFFLILAVPHFPKGSYEIREGYFLQWNNPDFTSGLDGLTGKTALDAYISSSQKTIAK